MLLFFVSYNADSTHFGFDFNLNKCKINFCLHYSSLADAIADKVAVTTQQDEEIRCLKGQLEQYSANLKRLEDEKQAVDAKLNELTAIHAENSTQLVAQTQLASQKDQEILALTHRLQAYDESNKSQEDLISKEIEQLRSQLTESQKQDAQAKLSSTETISHKETENNTLKEKLAHMEKAYEELSESLKQASSDKIQINELNAKVQELEKKLVVSANIIKAYIHFF